MLHALHTHGVSEIVAVTGIGAGDSCGHGGFLYDQIIEPTLLHTIYQDKDRQETLLRDSDRNWVILRPGIMTNREATGKYRVLLDLTGITLARLRAPMSLRSFCGSSTAMSFYTKRHC